MIESLPLAVTNVTTMLGKQALTNATGFFFERDGRLFVVTSRHVVPLILPAEEWAGIEAAIRQRATLLNKVLVDVYGEQQLLAEGLLPPALVYGHSGYLRPCRGIKTPGGVMLHLYAADLARSADGRWWVVDDRTQAPSGAGYALENRLVISRLYPELFRDLRVQRLASFFATLRDSLAHWAPAGGAWPARTPRMPGSPCTAARRRRAGAGGQSHRFPAPRIEQPPGR